MTEILVAAVVLALIIGAYRTGFKDGIAEGRHRAWKAAQLWVRKPGAMEWVAANRDFPMTGIANEVTPLRLKTRKR